jgi:glycosyltransferase involved in cell wall biosynthesis
MPADCSNSCKPVTLQILIPTYNRARLLSECLKSIIMQLPNSEPRVAVSILVSDNASTDTTGAVVQLASEQAPSGSVIYVKRYENIGFARNLHSGFGDSKSDWVWMLGDDDFLLPGAVAAVTSLLTSSLMEDADVLLVKYLECEENLTSFSCPIERSPFKEQRSRSDFLRAGLSHLNFIGQYVVRRTCYMEQQGEIGHSTCRFVPHLKAISMMLHTRNAIAINRYCVASRRNFSGPSQWAGIWPIVYGFEHPDIIMGADSDMQSSVNSLIGSLNVRSWIVMSIFRDEYDTAFNAISRPSTWKRGYRFLKLIESAIDWPPCRRFLRDFLIKAGGARITGPLKNAKKLMAYNHS